MKISSPWAGIAAFLIVLFLMPIGHASAILMQKLLGEQAVFQVAFLQGLIGIIILIFGLYTLNETKATFLGLFGGILVWNGWIEFTYVYYAQRCLVAPLIENGVVVTKPEYLIMPSSIGFWSIIMIFYIFGVQSHCNFFNWIRHALRYQINQNIITTKDKKDVLPIRRNYALTTFMELNMILWTCYLLLLFVYDKSFFGDHHPVTAIVAFGCLSWSVYLMIKLWKIKSLSYAIRYAIPTVIIFWNFVEILGRWNLLTEIWIQPMKYKTEMIVLSLFFIGAILWIILQKKKH